MKQIKKISAALFALSLLIIPCSSYAMGWSDYFHDEDFFEELETEPLETEEETEESESETERKTEENATAESESAESEEETEDAEEEAEEEAEAETDEFGNEEEENFYTTAQLNIRDEPEGNIIGTYAAYEKVEVFETKDGWCRTDKGWVSQQYLSEKDLSSAGTVEDWSERTLKEGATFDEKVEYFSDEAENAEYSHVSDTLFATVTSDTYGSGFYYLTHLIVRDPESQISGALSYDTFGGTREATTALAERKNAVVATNASYFSYETGQPSKGICITDGEVMRSGTSTGREMCLTKDGELFSASSGMTEQDLLAMGVTDTWTTSRPTLIADGQLKTFDGDKLYPRCAYGMVEPGEYYIIVAGTSEYNGGLTQKNLQEIFATLGCDYARPLDEGGSATLVFENQLLNTPAAGEERPVVDFIYFTD